MFQVEGLLGLEIVVLGEFIVNCFGDEGLTIKFCSNGNGSNAGMGVRPSRMSSSGPSSTIRPEIDNLGTRTQVRPTRTVHVLLFVY